MVILPEDFPSSIEDQLRSSTRRALAPLGVLPKRGPGATGTFAVDLAPGRYGLICFVRDADGQPHALRGMGSELRVQ